MEGCVYIISNKSLSTLKIGRTTKTALKRAKQFDNAALPHRFVAEYELRVKYNHEQLEEKVHKLLSSKWYGGECFNCNIEYATKIIKEAANEFNVTEEVFYWVEKAKTEAIHGISKAQEELAYAYYKGYGLPKDYKQAREWFEKSANQGHAKAQNYLGLMYYYKQGIETDNSENKESDSLFDNATEQHDLEHLNISNEHIKIAKKWLEKSVSQNNKDAQFNLGQMYYDNSWFEKDYKKSFELFEQSANQGNANAQFYLGKMYQYGDWVKSDIKQAEYWYLKAIENDDKMLQKIIQTCLGKRLF